MSNQNDTTETIEVDSLSIPKRGRPKNMRTVQKNMRRRQDIINNTTI